ncbi:MAG: tetratricopeptide repeat protein [Candidatus Acidiferrales bacterium]
MHKRVLSYSLILGIGTGLLLPAGAIAGRPPQVAASPDPSTGFNGVEMQYASANAEIYVKGPNGAPIAQPVVVTLLRTGGQFYAQDTTKAGFVQFVRVPFSEFTVQIIAPGYQPATKRFEVARPGAVTVTLNLQPMEAEAAASSAGFYALAPRTQKEVGKALEALRANKPNDARKHLEAAHKAAPASPEVEYLFGVYASQTNDPVQAKSYWIKALELEPKHLNALLAVGQDFLHENKPAEAQQYLKRAVDTAPSSWRAHALLAEALVLQKQDDEAINQAKRAIELGHDRAASAQLVMARAMFEKGDKGQATHILELYVQGHPADKETAKYLDRLEHPQPGDAPGDLPNAASAMAAATAAATELPVPSNWLPPDVDESVPSVVPGASCNVDDVVGKAGKQIMVLVSDVDRFAATETLTNQSIDKYGMASAPEKRKFNYVASIQEVQHGFLNVEEYRSTGSGGPAEFPGGVATNGLPALVLIFHPYNAVNFAMTCEGLAQLSTGPAWQVHFRQRPDKPDVIKRYRIGADGPSYPVALKGRAWISADNYQIVRLETDLVAPVPQIKLAADRADIEYGPVKFTKDNVNMWLPKSADVYYDWMGRRIHRRHSFSDYVLFAVDDQQKISAPKVDVAPADGGPSGEARPNQ